MRRLVSKILASRETLAWVLVLFAFLVSVPCQAQDQTLGGVVTDKSGAVIPDVDIKVTSVETGITRQVKTDKSGSFQVPGLNSGNYSVHLEHSGFADVEVTGIKLDVTGNRQLEIKLPVGKQQDTVMVSAEGVALNTTDASVSTVIDQQLISELPMNGRSLDTLFLLTPGVVQSGTQNAGGQYSVNGQRSSGNQLTVDGASGNVYVGLGVSGGPFGTGQTGSAGSTYATSASGGTNGLLPVDAIEEYRIQTSTYSAEYGRSPGGQIQVRSKGGTNAFHGTAFEYFRNQVLDATDWFVKYDGLKQAPLRMNDFGGTVGGPILKNRLFFFAAHETLFLDQPNNTSVGVPSALALQQVSQTFAPFLAAFPKGNGGTATTATYPQYTDTYNGEYATQIIDHSTSARLDARLPHDYNLFFRFNLAPSSSKTTVWNGTTANLGLYTYTLGLTKAINAHLVNDLTFNYTHNNGNYTYVQLPIDNADPSAFTQFCKNSSYSPSGQSLCLFGGVRGWAGLFDGQETAANLSQWNGIDVARWTLGRHTLALGADLRRVSTSFDPYTSNTISGNNAKTNGFQSLTGSTIYSITTSTETVKNVTIPVDNLSLFVQDDWHVTNRLTVNAGIRWEFNPPISDGHGGPLAISGNVDDLSTLGPAPTGTPLYKTTYTAFAPRLGVAYQLSDRQGFMTVLRAGAGIFYDTGQAASAASTIVDSYPYLVSATESNVPFSNLNFQALQQSAATQGLPQSRIYAVDPRLTLPYTGEWNIAIEQQLFGKSNTSLTYLGADGEQLGSTIESFGLAPALVAPTNGLLYVLTNHGRSNYQALQIQSTIRDGSLIDGVIAYTYSHNIDNGTSDFTGPLANETGYRANADDDIRHVFSAGISIRSRGTFSNRLFRVTTSNWIFNTFTRLQTATPLSVGAENEDATLTELNSINNLADIVPGVPVYLREGLGSNGKRIPGGVQLNPAAFTDPPRSANGSFLRDGNSGRNAYRLFGLKEFDISAGRKFALTERLGFEFKVEAFNVLNTANFADVQTSVGDVNFGQAQNTTAGWYGGNGGGGGLNTVFQSGGPRNVQLTARIIF